MVKKVGRLILVITALCLVLTMNNPVFAKLPDSLKGEYHQNKIYFYNKYKSRSVCASGSINIYGGAIEEKIWVGLTSFMTDEQAAGVMGNMAHEGLFNPAMHEIALKNQHQPGFDLGSNEDISYGIGLIQWSFGRRTRLVEYIKSVNSELMSYLEDYNSYSADYSYNGAKFLELAGDDVTNSLISVELEFLKDELMNNGSYSGIFEQATVHDAAEYFLLNVERPADMYSKIEQRAADAEGFYEQFSGGNISDSGSSSSSCNTNGGALAEYVLKYAWPEYMGSPYTDRMPDYADVVAKRLSEGKYVGGSVNGVQGIDCGGWVTTLLNESGFEPNYNNGNGNTDRQEAWVKANGWELLNPSGNVDTSILEPGDVAFTTGHTWVYVGEIEGFATKIASASYSSNPPYSSARAPMAGYESYEGARWYRKGGTSE